MSPQLSLRRLNQDPLAVLNTLSAHQGSVAIGRLGRQRLIYLSAPEVIEEAFVRNSERMGKWGDINRWWRQGPEPFRDSPHWIATHRKEKYLPVRRALLARYARGRVPAETATLASLSEQWLERVDGQVIDLFAFAEELLMACGAYHIFGLVLEPEEVADLTRLYRGSVAGSLQGSYGSKVLHWTRRNISQREAWPDHAAAEQSFTEAIKELLERGNKSDPKGLPSLYAAGVIDVTAASGIPGAPEPLVQLLLATREAELRARLAEEADSVAAKEMSAGYYAAVREAVRLGSIWRINRIVHEPFSLAAEATAVSVRRGDILISSPRLLHRDPRLWAKPDSFSLDHWSLEAEHGRHIRGFIPFGFPSRACVGKHIVYRQLAATASVVVARWKLELLAPAPSWRCRGDSEMIPNAPILARFSRA